MLKNKLQDNLHTALKDHEALRVSVLRMILADVKNKEIELQKEADDTVVTACIQKQKKQLEETLPLFEKAGRTDIITEYKAQIEILTSYLPEQLSPEALKGQVEQFLLSPELQGLPEVALIGKTIGRFKDVATADAVRALVLELKAS